MKNLNKALLIICQVLLVVSINSCEKDSPDAKSISILESNGFFVVNEGNFNSGNSSLSFFSYDSVKVNNSIFSIVNERPLGDVANSALASGANLYIVVNNSDKIEIANIETLGSTGRIDGLVSPRFIGMISKTKAYVSSLYSDSLAIINPLSLEVTGYINLESSSEHITVYGDITFISNWSGGKSVSVIDNKNDIILRKIELAPEPGRVVIDAYGFAWVLCSGGYLNEEFPVLFKIETAEGNILDSFQFENKNESPSELCIDHQGINLYFINRDIFRMSVNAVALPVEPLVEAEGRNFYRMDFDRGNQVLLITDAMDFMQRGYVYGFTPEGTALFNFRAGIIPGSFCFRDYQSIK